jgi:hypothetical protein
VVAAARPLQPHVVPQPRHPQHRLHLLPVLPQQVHLHAVLALVAVDEVVDAAARLLLRLLPLHSTRSWTRFSPMAVTACIR